MRTSFSHMNGGSHEWWVTPPGVPNNFPTQKDKKEIDQ